MAHFQERMRSEITVMELLERRRAETGDPNLGRCVENALIERCLSDLEWDLFLDPPELPAY
jgi:hypothetical protein